MLKETHHLALSPQGLCQAKTSDDSENASRDPVFNPELVIAHCFKQFKQDFHLPRSRRRIIILPQKEDPEPVRPTPQPQAPPQPSPICKGLEAGDIQEQPEDTRTWLSQRLKFRQDLESFGNTERWLQNKSSLTPSEAKILHRIHAERAAQVVAHLPATRPTKVSSSICQMKTLRGVAAGWGLFTPFHRGANRSPEREVY